MKYTNMMGSINDILCLERLSNPHPIAVSADGNRLAVVTQSHRRRQTIEKVDERLLPTGLLVGSEGSEILLIDIKSGESRNLTPNWGTSYRPAWSPDGKKLAFYSDKHGSAQLWMWEGDESEPRTVSDVTIRHFSPNSPPPFGPQMGRVLSSSCNLKQR